MTKPKHAAEDFDAFDCSSALSMCSRTGITKPCEECGNLTPVRMEQGNRCWIRCFMCQHDGPKARTMLAAIELWEHENE
jgi:hypothetical protein